MTKELFPLLPEDPPIRGPIRASRMGRRRAVVLGAVQLAIVLHITHWLTSGRTLSPVEPSESMRTLEFGEVNAGFVFFALALLSTLIFGRFFCGWGCHIVALQDLCAWLLRRAGIKPRPLRSRLLLWVPSALAFSMFVWPVLKRFVLPPLGMPLTPFPGFSDHLMTENFWATFPGIALSIPFLFICGFVVVYLLGSKGFCTYGCPYGGLFVPADRWARGRIRVSDACNGCGHCTATCTSNVRVHEEVRTFKMVVDPGCMKCMDCVSVCPKDALSFGFAGPSREAAIRAAEKKSPAKGAQPAGRLPWLARADDLGLLALFGGAFFGFRRLYDVIPMLMAVGMALSVVGLVWATLQMVRQPDAALQTLPLRRAGRVQMGGYAVAGFTLLALLFLAQSIAVQVMRASADRLDRGVLVSREFVFEGGVSNDAAITPRAERALTAYRRADSFAFGGWGLAETPQNAVRRAWLSLVVGRPDEALTQLDRAIRKAPTNASLHRGRAAAHLQKGELDPAIAALVVATNLDPSDTEVAAQLRALRQKAEDARR